MVFSFSLCCVLVLEKIFNKDTNSPPLAHYITTGSKSKLIQYNSPPLTNNSITIYKKYVGPAPDSRNNSSNSKRDVEAPYPTKYDKEIFIYEGNRNSS